MAKQQSLATNVLWKFAERTSSQLISFIVSVVLARILEPSDYGLIAMAAVFTVFTNILVDGGFSNALIQKKDANSLDFSSVFYLCIGISAILYAILFICAPIIADFYSYPVLTSVLRVLGISVVISPLSIVQRAYVSRHMIFKRFFWSTFGGTAVSAVVGIGMAYLGFGVWALVAQQLTDRFVGVLVLWFTVRWRPELKYSWVSTKKLFSYGWMLLLDGILNAFLSEIRALMIGKIYTSADLAFYNQGNKFPQVIMASINESIQAVTFSAASKKQDNLATLKELTRKTIRISSYLMFPLITGLAVIAEPLVSLLLTDKWLPAVPFIWIACFGNAIIIMQIAIQNAVMAIGRSDVHFKMNLISKIISFVLLLSVMKISVMAIACTVLITGIPNVLIKMFVGKRYIGYTYKENFIDNAPILLGSAIMGVLIYLLKFLNLGNIETLCIQVTAGFIIYALFSIIVKPEGYYFISTYIKNFFISNIHKG